jgi:oligoendopeptidase F
MSDATQPTVTGAENIVWDLSPLYASVDDPDLQQDIVTVKADAEKFAIEHRGKVGSYDAEELREMVEQYNDIYRRSARIESYAYMMFSVDSANPAIGALLQQVNETESYVRQQTVFLELEWNTLEDGHVDGLLKNPVLAPYAHHLEVMRSSKPHQLSEAEERIILEKDVVGIQAWNRFYDQFLTGLRYEFDGESKNLSEVLKKGYHPDREIRQRALASVGTTLRDNLSTLSFMYNVMATNKAIDDRLRNYPTWISSRNLANKAPDSVVEALIQSVTSNYEIVARHYRLKRVLLGLDELHEYDRYAPLATKESNKTYTWEEAKTIVLNAFYAFSEETGQAAQRFFDENWIHAAPSDTKRGGAYATPVTPDVHPYVFMSYTGTARDVMTLAHELGHGIHMLFSSNGVLNDLYTPLTTAETASTFAEMLVFHDLLSREDDKEVQLSMLVQKIEDSFATIFRQVSMNRFEHGLHTTRREKGEPSPEQISDIWMETQGAMYGDSLTLTDNYRVFWSYIPHFIHTPGYVYAYAFGELLVLALFNIYQQEGASFAPKYLEVLKAGNNNYPDAIIAKVGVDLNDPNFWNEGINALSALVDQEEALARELYPEKF